MCKNIDVYVIIYNEMCSVIYLQLRRIFFVQTIFLTNYNSLGANDCSTHTEHIMSILFY